MFEKLLNLIRQANPGYYATYEEQTMMNIRADRIPYQKGPHEQDIPTKLIGFPDGEMIPKPLLGFAYIEEFRQGKYSKERFWRSESTRIQIWFCKATQFQNNAIIREKQRQAIKSEIVIPFISEFEKSNLFTPVDTWNWYAPPSRFDMNEVSIMLEAEIKELSC